MSARRVGVPVPARHRKDLTEAEATGTILVIAGIALHPPTAARATWRVIFHYSGSHELSGGSTHETAWQAFLLQQELRASLEAGFAGRPEHAHVTVTSMIDSYFVARGKSGRWTDKTLDCRKSNFKELRTAGAKLKCADLNAFHVRRALTTAAGTRSSADTIRSVWGTALRWGATSGYLTPAQAQLMEQVTWTPPSTSGYVPAATRRDQAKSFSPSVTGAPGGNVPTHGQVIDFARRSQIYYRHGEALVHCSANLGMREGETLLLTADPRVALAGLGNFVDLDSWDVRVRFQALSGGGTSLPKQSKQRDVIIPAVEQIATGFDLPAWLEEASIRALREQEQGKNDRALLLGSPRGQVWSDSNLRNRVLTRAADDLGWRMNEYATAHGQKRAMYRFTLHSMRDRYATTAIKEWGYPEQQLLQQGSWEDPEVVRKFYAGTTDDTYNEVRARHGRPVRNLD